VAGELIGRAIARHRLVVFMRASVGLSLEHTLLEFNEAEASGGRS
jgi:hypothetical protein